MTKIEDYYRDMNKLWSAIILISSIALSALLILVLHLIFGGR